MELVVIFMVAMVIEILARIGLKVWNYLNPTRQYRIKESADEEPSTALMIVTLIAIFGSMFIMCL